MPTLLPIARLGNPSRVLTQEAALVQNAQALETQRLIDDMFYSCEYFGGMGLAAPQVFMSIQVIVVMSKPNVRYPHAPLVKPFAMVNPVITSRFGSLERGWEGCLSIPGLRGIVPRSPTIQVEYRESGGDVVSREFEGFVARIIQHEIDHLHGKLFIDRTGGSQDLATEEEYQKLVAVGKHLNP